MKLVLAFEIVLLAAAFVALHRAFRVREVHAAALAGEALHVTARRAVRDAPNLIARNRAPRALRPPC